MMQMNPRFSILGIFGIVTTFLFSGCGGENGALENPDNQNSSSLYQSKSIGPEITMTATPTPPPTPNPFDQDPDSYSSDVESSLLGTVSGNGYNSVGPRAAGPGFTVTVRTH